MQRKFNRSQDEIYTIYMVSFYAFIICEKRRSFAYKCVENLIFIRFSNYSDRQDRDTSPRAEPEDKWEGVQGACRVQPELQFLRVLSHPPDTVCSLQRCPQDHGDRRNNNTNRRCVDKYIRRKYEEDHGDMSPTSSKQAILEVDASAHGSRHISFHPTKADGLVHLIADRSQLHRSKRSNLAERAGRNYSELALTKKKLGGFPVVTGY